MTADDISRDALIERLRVAMLGTTDGDFIDPECDIPAGEMFRLAVEWLDAVVLPLVQERDRMRTELAEAQRVDVERFASLATVTNNCMGALAERDAAIKRAEAAEQKRDHFKTRFNEVANEAARLRQQLLHIKKEQEQ